MPFPYLKSLFFVGANPCVRPDDHPDITGQAQGPAPANIMDTTGQTQGKRSEAQWYLLAYDVRNEKRLRKLHYFCKKRGVSLQRSVFLLKADSIDLEEVVDGILARVNEKEDDVRLYPVPYPGAVWTAGRQNDKLHGLYGGSAPKQERTGVGRFFRRLFGGKKRV